MLRKNAPSSRLTRGGQNRFRRGGFARRPLTLNEVERALSVDKCDLGVGLTAGPMAGQFFTSIIGDFGFSFDTVPRLFSFAAQNGFSPVEKNRPDPNALAASGYPFAEIPSQLLHQFD